MIQRPDTLALAIYTRRDCCLCDEMKQILYNVIGAEVVLQEINVDQSVELQTRFGDEVPVLFINGRKAFKYRLTERQLRAKLREYRKRTWAGLLG